MISGCLTKMLRICPNCCSSSWLSFCSAACKLPLAASSQALNTIQYFILLFLKLNSFLSARVAARSPANL
ncbi:hypothetical protein AMR44_14175 [Shewanella algae]|nr:hypothetical protein AMR44_14175 [Shewanella algae]